MVYFGSVTSFFFEKYSLIDVNLLKTEWEHVSDAKAKGDSYVPTQAVQERIFKPLKVTKNVEYRRVAGKLERHESYEDNEGIGGFYFPAGCTPIEYTLCSNLLCAASLSAIPSSKIFFIFVYCSFPTSIFPMAYLSDLALKQNMHSVSPSQLWQK